MGVEFPAVKLPLPELSNAGGKAGYLPPEMRTADYDGPAPKAAAKKPAAKKAKAANPLVGVFGLSIMDQIVARERRNFILVAHL